MVVRNFLLLAGLAGVLSAKDGWGYEEWDGPDTWDGVCMTGRSQSPIDIHASEIDYALIHRLHFVHYDYRNMITLNNNGHTISGSGFSTWLSKQPYITNGGLKHKYKLEQFHLHWADEDHHGSEHKLGGLSYAAELHLVHHREDLTFREAVKVRGGLAVVGVFLTIGDDSRAMEAVASILPEVGHPGNTTEVHGFHTRRLLPVRHDAFYRYDGSLTTPGCFESVIWTIIAEPIVVTRKQMDALRSVHSVEGKPYKYNNRPIQPLNGRKVLYRPSHFDKSLLCGAGTEYLPLATFIIVFVFSFFHL